MKPQVSLLFLSFPGLRPYDWLSRYARLTATLSTALGRVINGPASCVFYGHIPPTTQLSECNTDDVVDCRVTGPSWLRSPFASPTLRDVLRSLIDSLFDREIPRRPIVPESMTAVDRKQLALLHKVLARPVEDKIEDRRLGEDGDTAHQLDRAQALEAGWTAEYDMEFYVMEPELSRRDCGLVMDIFTMFRMLKHSIGKVGDQLNDTDLAMLTCHGFDLNHELEGRLLQYARRLISDGERWQEQAEVFTAENDRGNSHMPTRGSYQRMLAADRPSARASQSPEP